MKRETNSLKIGILLITLLQAICIPTGLVLISTITIVSTEEKVYASTAEIYYKIGIEKAKSGDFQSAKIAFNMAKSLVDHYGLYYNLGWVNFKLGENEEAIFNLQKSIELNQEYAPTYSMMGKILNSLGDYNRAITYINKAIELNPQSIAAYQNLAIAKQNLGDNDGAISTLTKVITLNTKDKQAYKYRGLNKEKTGDLNGACIDWKIASILGEEESKRWLSEKCP